jgi:hypothetical protein
MPRPAGPLSEPYKRLHLAAKADLKSGETSARLIDLILTSLGFLSTQCKIVDLGSRVPGKDYFSFATKEEPGALSRPVNRSLFLAKQADVADQWKQWAAGGHKGKGTERLSYTMGTAYGVASDLFDRYNKKGPATYFEALVGHLFARTLGVNPTKKATLPVLGRSVRMTMDFLIDVGKGRPALHVPVKASTRERVVQAWAHQRLLDAAYGHAKYRGVLVVHSETKLDLRTREVVEICVPDQWLAYQKFLSRMDRIYYFDIPNRYAQLAREFPDDIPLKQFSAFFAEREALLTAPLAPS